MARATQTQDYDYEVEKGVVIGIVGMKVLVEMDKFNVGDADNKIKVTSSNTDAYGFHVSLNKNRNKYGLHPRHLELEFESNAPDSTCNVVDPKRRVKVIVLTVEQFSLLKVYNKSLDNAVDQPLTTIRINHTADGTGYLDYRIIKKVSERQL